VQRVGVGRRDVVEQHEDGRRGILHDGGKGAAIGATVNQLGATEGQSPAGEPARSAYRRRRAPTLHLYGIEVDPVRSVKRHAPKRIGASGRLAAVSTPVPRVAVLGGGPAGYEAALVAAQLGAQVTLIDRDGIGGACVLSDCVPSKTLIATSEVMTAVAGAGALGVHLDDGGGESQLASEDEGSAITPPDVVQLATKQVFDRVQKLAAAQSADIAAGLARAGVDLIAGSARFVAPTRLAITLADGANSGLGADVVLIATGATPRELPGTVVDGERILTWRQLYDLPELPDHLIVIGSGVTGAEFASAFRALGSAVSLVSSRDRVLPGEDEDAARVIEDVFHRRGVNLVGQSRAARAVNTGQGVRVELTDGRALEGSHCLLAVGSVPQTNGLHLHAAGVATDDHGFVRADRVSRTSVPSVYAAGDCTGVLMLASVAAMQGRIAMWHALGEAVAPLRLATVSANVFTDPEIATVGISQAMVDRGDVQAEVVSLPLKTNARAKMQGLDDGFVKLFARPGSGQILGGVVVAPRASELILAVSLAVQNGLTAGQVAHTFSIYPSLSGSLNEAARRLMQRT
jgi:pyruvate/2-oxoglutarate dehydrogenase complex dihydrolipoamide dehydrogenase (E3) component